MMRRFVIYWDEGACTVRQQLSSMSVSPLVALISTHYIREETVRRDIQHHTIVGFCFFGYHAGEMGSFHCISLPLKVKKEEEEEGAAGGGGEGETDEYLSKAHVFRREHGVGYVAK